MQLPGDYGDFGFLYGGGGGGGGPSLAAIRKIAKQKKVARLLEAAEATLRPLFDVYEAMDDGTSAFYAEPPGELQPRAYSREPLLMLELSRSKRRRGLRFLLYREGLLRYLLIPATDSPTQLREGLGVDVTEGVAVGKDDRHFEAGWFSDEPAIDRAAEFMARCREQAN
jgi:hypothetical protein